MRESIRLTRPVWLGDDRRRFDHIRKHFSVIKDARTKAMHLALYDALCLCAEVTNGETEEIPNATFQSITGLSESSVRRALADLEGWGYVEIHKVSGRGNYNRYVLLPPPKTRQGDRFYREKVSEKVSGSQSPPIKEQRTNKSRDFQSNQKPKPDEHYARLPEWTPEYQQILESLPVTDPEPVTEREDVKAQAAKARQAKQALNRKGK